MKFHDLIERARTKLGSSLDCPPLSIDEVALVIVKEMGFDVDKNGEIYNPAPAPRISESQNFRYSGQPRRPRGRR